MRGVHVEEREDQLAGEEPMVIRAAGPGQAPVDVAVTMRTPGHEADLAAGFLFTEGLIEHGGDIANHRGGDERVADLRHRSGEFHIRSLEHRVRALDQGNKSAGFNHSNRRL